MFKINPCNLCARYCDVDRTSRRGYCRIDSGLYISTICIHKGEEPVLSGDKGVCNVFFDHCNLQCQYCQNYQISNNVSSLEKDSMSLQDCYEKIAKILDTGCNMLGLVSPTPYLHHIDLLVDMLRKNRYEPTIIYNTNAYDNVDTLRNLDGIVDVYLPDYKYGSYELAQQLSQADDYPDMALDAINEMVRQKCKDLILNDEGMAVKGVIVRHLVLPGHIDNSFSALTNIATEVSADIHISLMAQYYPTYNAEKFPELSRKVTNEEYEQVKQFMYSMGMTNGWVQSLDSTEVFKPDFDKKEEVFG